MAPNFVGDELENLTDSDYKSDCRLEIPDFPTASGQIDNIRNDSDTEDVSHTLVRVCPSGQETIPGAGRPVTGALYRKTDLKIATASAKSDPASDTGVLRPYPLCLDSPSCAFYASYTLAPHLVASGVSGDPSQYCVPSEHLRPSNPASMHPDSNLNTIAHHNLPLLLSLLPAFSEAQPQVRKGYFLAKKIWLMLAPGEQAIIPLILNLR